ncbi:hypothetical protein ACSSWA_11290 [Melioribacter sp. Ez-97]|uniref:hypothetical protein n=1 Tax=Melioribacter sp. Ez-97 TaxID=3423434 RepID=UPI003ED95277
MKTLNLVNSPDEVDKQTWSDFVLNHPYGNAFQTPEMYEAYRNTPNYEPIFVVAVDNQKILGVLN